MKLSAVFSSSCYSSAIAKNALQPPSLITLSASTFLPPLSRKLSCRHGVSYNRLSFRGNSSFSSTAVSASKSDSQSQGSESFFRDTLRSMETVYLNRNPTAKSILKLVSSVDDEQICYDHLAFRTFGVNGYGINSLASLFLDYGYTPKEELRFPAKKLKALWFSPPNSSSQDGGSGVNGPLPRVFISELLVDQLSPRAQEIIRKYTKKSGSGNKYAALASALGSLTWEKPLYSEFQQLAGESEYAAWTIVNGYALNHVTISTHRLKSNLRNIKSLNEFIEKNGFKLNSDGGVLKVSPDGLLLQSSTVADSMPFSFPDGVDESVPCSYIEFAERLVLPQYKNLSESEIKESHRRDGFEVGNADKIFESTSKEQLTRRA
ncbi:Scaffold attachment factor B2 [Gossypium arboreum]|uniref:2-oxoadipate dioxygenase/decarboxylase n=2 Tax=Gossypium arboreum TaxID=29729 RepID=A0A0B0P5E7_GOSAR|nr:uncharacterized protein LOC108463643 [Gossypium arboreum]KAK5770981.1 hypothetical protein PVK06_047148 [Gossypium arboreum]KHG18601.1 Scaffold attachment factor B2 [Gossypium arboreum]